jgi:hypothetical protein
MQKSSEVKVRTTCAVAVVIDALSLCYKYIRSGWFAMFFIENGILCLILDVTYCTKKQRAGGTPRK